jgi:hypothetical protein
MQGVCKFWRGESGYGFLALTMGTAITLSTRPC